MNIGKGIILAAVLVLYGTCAYAVAPSCYNGSRYQDLNNGTVLDCNTGLIWLKEAKCMDTSNLVTPDANGKLTWYDATIWATGLKSGICNLTDGSAPGAWRLPTKTELIEMISEAKQAGYSNPMLTNATGSGPWTTNGDAFNNVQSTQYWSSTPNPISTSNAWYVNVGSGWVNGPGKTNALNVWAVRGVQSGAFDTLIVE